MVRTALSHPLKIHQTRVSIHVYTWLYKQWPWWAHLCPGWQSLRSDIHQDESGAARTSTPALEIASSASSSNANRRARRSPERYSRARLAGASSRLGSSCGNRAPPSAGGLPRVQDSPRPGYLGMPAWCASAAAHGTARWVIVQPGGCVGSAAVNRTEMFSREGGAGVHFCEAD
jgi:hypothetical protein